MALCEMKYFSNSLQKQTGMYVAIPDGQGPFRVVYQLHGLSDDYSMWLRRTNIERYADNCGLMVVMPDGGRSFYSDMVNGTGNYEQHILETVRLVDRTFPTIANASGRAIGGLSMGGYGCMKLGLKYPELFSSIASHSGVLDFNPQVAKGFSLDFQAIFGTTLGASNDCMALAAIPGAKPAIYFDCGVDDGLIGNNRIFHEELLKLNIEHTYHEYPGTHDWDFWDTHVQEAFAFHLEHLEKVTG